ncbi:hypothetical protein ACH5RR_019573 [Cinchona calisaya]|uniref:DUF7610 domain-containing protein n=1 Tax=Cinchona calisaya TaxID=153742 RepID=A0ABD2ZPY1_9GENT
MTKRYKILRKKLKELKAELIFIFSLPGGEKNIHSSPSYNHQHLSEEIEQRFMFLRNLLSAEMASNPSKPHHLHHIARALDEYEAAFREWEEHVTTTSAAAANVNKNKFDDTATTSICSCDDSCRNDDGEEEEKGYSNSNNSVDQEGSGFNQGELVDVDVHVLEEEEEEEDKAVKKVEEKQKGKSYASNCGRVISGMIFGGVLMGVIMVRFSGCFYSNFAVDDHSFLIPT